MITIQQETFSIELITEKIRRSSKNIGAIVTFVGYVRDFDKDEHKKLFSMKLEHYSGMTEKILADIDKKANSRWALTATEIIHRVGELEPTEPIVCVAVASKHRNDAFDAARFIIDFLKTDAPFWKKEKTNKGEYWVDDKDSDHKQKKSWSRTSEKS